MTTGKLFRVVADHAPSYPVAMVAAAGTRLVIDDTRSGFPGWVWGRAPDGVEAWVPEGYLQGHGAITRFRFDYDSTELSVATGEMVEVMEETAGWSWCRLSDGRTGWIPTGNLVPAP